MTTYHIPIRLLNLASTSGFERLGQDAEVLSRQASTFELALQLKPYLILQGNSSQSAPESAPSVESYRELEAALLELHELDSEEDWQIKESVYNSSVQIAAALMDQGIPRPGVFTHGPQSVVFNWTSALDNFYLTITQDNMYVLISSPEEIKYRGELGKVLTSRATDLFSALGSAKLASPILLDYQPSATTSDGTR
jgi:hypothetical protein